MRHLICLGAGPVHSYNARMSLLKSASIVSLLTLASRITGLVRELLIAAAFGASATTDAFNVAFRIPNLLRRLFAEGAFSQAFVPILAESRTKNGEQATHDLVNDLEGARAAGLPVLLYDPEGKQPTLPRQLQ
mgnify:CR=1 FL=1